MGYILLVLLCACPYLILLYKKENLQIRLLFSSLFSLLLYVLLACLISLRNYNILFGIYFWYSLLMWSSIIINILIIIVLTLVKALANRKG